MAFIASSKLNGWSEIGFAFPMDALQWQTQLNILRTYISADHALPEACSATCYDSIENIGILAVIVAKRELRQIERQIFLAHVVIRAHDATFQQAPEAFQVVRMHVPAHVFFPRMFDRFMRKLTVQVRVGPGFIGRDQRDPFVHGLSDEFVERHAIRVFNDLADDVTLASNRANDSSLAFRSASNMAFLIPVAVLVAPANIGFVYFYFAHELGKSAIFHCGSDAMADIPGGAVSAAADLPVNLQGTHAFLALRHQVDHLKPCAQRIVRILKDRLGNHGEAIAVPSAACLPLQIQ